MGSGFFNLNKMNLTFSLAILFLVIASIVKLSLIALNKAPEEKSNEVPLIWYLLGPLFMIGIYWLSGAFSIFNIWDIALIAKIMVSASLYYFNKGKELHVTIRFTLLLITTFLCYKAGVFDPIITLI